jgi:Bifunctional DNA primase/polymerase, N-terminal/Protein of unknown function (DUF3987)
MSIVSNPANENHILAAALSYAGRGWPVCPIYSVLDGRCTCGKKKCDNAGKHPVTPHGLKDATSDAETIRYWWNQWPSANIAIATGAESGVFMLGPDGQQGILDLARLEQEHGPLPATPRERSGSGGLHYYFAWPADGKVKNRKNHNGLKIDVRGSGGYSIAAPSVNGAGPYQWEVSPDQIEVAPAPQWLLDWIRNDGKTIPAAPRMAFTVGADAPDAQARAVKYLASCPPAISGQAGHAQTLAVTRAVVFGFDLGVDVGFDLLMSHYNGRCVPPWSESEMLHKCREADTLPFDKHRGYLLDDAGGAGGAGAGGAAGAGPAEDGQQAQADAEVDIEDMPIPPPPRWPTLHPEALHGLAGEIVRTVAPETESGEAAILVQLLVLFGNAVGRGPHFRVGPARHHANLFTKIVGDTSSAKGMSLDIAQDVITRADPTWADACIHRGLGSGEGVIEATRDAVTKLQPVKDKTTGAVTGFETKIIEPGGKDKRLLAVETEFAAVLKRNKRESSILSETLRCGWDGNVLEVLNRKENALRATGAHISVVGHITPDELRRVIAGTPELVNGFSNRFLFVLTRSSRSLPHGGDASVLDRFVEPMAAAITTARSIGQVQRSKAANRLWESVYDDLKRSRPGDYGKARERARPQTMRLALVYALLDGAAAIEADHLQAALALWAYCDESLQLIFGGSEPSDAVADQVLQKISEAPGGLTRTQLRDAFNRNLKNNMLLEALAKLRDKGLIESVALPTGGRPAELWKLRPNDITTKGAKEDNQVPSLRRSVAGESGERVVRV